MTPKKYPVTNSKKKISSRKWKVDPTTGARFKSVMPTPAKNLKLDSAEEFFEEVSSSPVKLTDYKRHLKASSTELTGKKTIEIINYSLEWLPTADDYPKHVFALFLNTSKLEKGALDLFITKNLVHGYYNNYVILSTRNRDFEFYTNVIKFFFSFRSVMVNTKHKYQEPILIRELTGSSANPTFLIFSTTRGRGLLVKSLEDTKYSGGINTELDVLRIGKILGANVPRNALVVHNTRSSLYKSFAKDAEILVEDLSPIIASFSWVDTKLLESLQQDDPENLGRLFVFDIITGSWDRHSGNYLVTNTKGYKSLQEIDFGLFRPDFYINEDFIEEDDYRQKYPSKYPQYPGWGIFINSKVVKLMQNTDARKFQLGIEAAIKKIHSTLFKHKVELKHFTSEKLVKRINAFFVPESQVQQSFWFYLDKINNLNDREALAELLLKLSS